MTLLDLLKGRYWSRADREPIQESLPMEIPASATFFDTEQIAEEIRHPLYGKVERRLFGAKWKSATGGVYVMSFYRHYRVRTYHMSGITGKIKCLS